MLPASPLLAPPVPLVVEAPLVYLGAGMLPAGLEPEVQVVVVAAIVVESEVFAPVCRPKEPLRAVGAEVALEGSAVAGGALAVVVG